MWLQAADTAWEDLALARERALRQLASAQLAHDAESLNVYCAMKDLVQAASEAEEKLVHKRAVIFLQRCHLHIHSEAFVYTQYLCFEASA